MRVVFVKRVWCVCVLQFEINRRCKGCQTILYCSVLQGCITSMAVLFWRPLGFVVFTTVLLVCLLCFDRTHFLETMLKQCCISDDLTKLSETRCRALAEIKTGCVGPMRKLTEGDGDIRHHTLGTLAKSVVGGVWTLLDDRRKPRFPSLRSFEDVR